jgi:uridine phosphorylase
MKNEVRRKTTLLQKHLDLTLHRVEIIAAHPGNPERESRIAYYVVENAVVSMRRIFKGHMAALNFFRPQKRDMDGS